MGKDVGTASVLLLVGTTGTPLEIDGTPLYPLVADKPEVGMTPVADKLETPGMGIDAVP
jgi:hypothetical protein